MPQDNIGMEPPLHAKLVNILVLLAHSLPLTALVALLVSLSTKTCASQLPITVVQEDIKIPMVTVSPVLINAPLACQLQSAHHAPVVTTLMVMIASRPSTNSNNSASPSNLPANEETQLS